MVAGVLRLFPGTLGIGRFRAGSAGVGIARLLTCGGPGFRALIDGIVLLAGDDRTGSKGRVPRG
ncbi:TM2 domain-containing protein [Streptomyces thermoalcalitolerans]|uniref:TM2 domain-containing protein n=1 Tax=Streptomyces thermoalcalitolerans TaxID=65605 RepID=UPI0031D4C3BE